MAPATRAVTRSARIRELLDHPVIDGDGHIVELLPLFADFVRDHGREDLVAACPMLTRGPEFKPEELPADVRRQAGLYPAFWAVAAEAEYFATVTTPRRYSERLGEAGIDYAVLYPTMGLNFAQIIDDDQRVSLCRLYNEFMAEEYGPYRDRFTVAAVIPMHSPSEAIDALTHAKRTGAKVALISSFVRRPMPGERWPPEDPLSAQRNPVFTSSGWVDTYGIDSMFDYDPVWSTAIDLALPLGAHSHAIGFSDRASISSFMYNQIGSFAAAGEALAKSLFFGGVTYRFPQLRLALLEGGVSEGVRLFNTLLSAWHKRGPQGIERLNPAHVDRALLGNLLAESDPRLARYAPDDLIWPGGPMNGQPDEFAAAGLETDEDVRDRFCTNFYWGCEGDDPLVGVAFDTRITPRGARVPAMFGSDIGHWDVPDFDAPLAEAFELVERGILDADSFRDFVFTNPLRFYASLDDEFFDGTTIEREAAAALSATEK